MTVAPRRSPDGQHVSTGANGVGPIKSDQSELPPTLFSLPKLHSGNELAASAPDASCPPANHQRASADSAPTQVDVVTPESEPDTRHSAANASRGPSTDAASYPALDQPFPPLDMPASVPNLGIPAGRTWMERVGSNALVVTMLGIVVAAAMLTGRGQPDPSQLDGAMADREDMQLDFDDVTESQLPIPDHSHRSSPVEVAESTSVESFPVSGLPGPTDLGPSDLVSPNSNQVFAQDQWNEAEVPISKIEAPVANAAPAATMAAANNDWSTTDGSSPIKVTVPAQSGIRTNEFFDGSTSISASTVSNRTVLQDEALSFPSLEELEAGNPSQSYAQGDPYTLATPATPATPNKPATTAPSATTPMDPDVPDQTWAAPTAPSGHPGPEFTRTPFAIEDWSIYLPPLSSTQ